MFTYKCEEVLFTTAITPSDVVASGSAPALSSILQHSSSSQCAAACKAVWPALWCVKFSVCYLLFAKGDGYLLDTLRFTPFARNNTDNIGSAAYLGD